MYDLASLSLQPPASFPELYQELWWYSGSYANVPSAGYYVLKGSTSYGGPTVGGAQLYKLSSSWSASTKCAFEVSMASANAGTVAQAQLYDATTSTLVTSSQVSVSGANFTVVRSGQFTLTPGHTYEVYVTNTGGYNSYITDASLIIFPPAGSVSPSLSSISLANPSGGTLKEAYIPLWVYSSGTASSSATSASSSTLLQKGSTSMGASSSSTTKLHTLSANWSSNQKFAFETSIWTNNNVQTAYAELWDITSGTAVSGSQVSTTSTTATLLRSGSFTLTPSHIYGVTAWNSNSGFQTSITKAHLVALA